MTSATIERPPTQAAEWYTLMRRNLNGITEWSIGCEANGQTTEIVARDVDSDAAYDKAIAQLRQWRKTVAQ